MDKYEKLVDKIAQQTGTPFGPAWKEVVREGLCVT